MTGLGAPTGTQFDFDKCFYHAAYFDASHEALPLNGSCTGASGYLLNRRFAAQNLVPEVCHPYRDRMMFSDVIMLSCASMLRARFAPVALLD